MVRRCRTNRRFAVCKDHLQLGQLLREGTTLSGETKAMPPVKRQCPVVVVQNPEPGRPPALGHGKLEQLGSVALILLRREDIQVFDQVFLDGDNPPQGNPL